MRTVAQNEIRQKLYLRESTSNKYEILSEKNQFSTDIN